MSEANIIELLSAGGRGGFITRIATDGCGRMYAGGRGGFITWIATHGCGWMYARGA